MALADRIGLIQRIQELRGSKVITYLTSDRRFFPPGFPLPGLPTQLSTEAQSFIYDQVQSIGRNDNLDLFIYTRGGDTDSVWPLVSILREFTRVKFSVLIPFRCHSGGTLISLGANEIVMGEAGELSPIDPTTGNQFNPVDEQNPQRRKGISVEDVTSYIELAKDPSKVGLKDSGHILEVFKRLSQEVHPIALGNVYRAHTQIRILADKLLKMHLNGDEEKPRIDRIVDYLTRGLYSHIHAINRREAKEVLGADIVKEADGELQDFIWQLYQQYAQSLSFHETLCIDSLAVSGQQLHDLNIIGGFIETENQSFLYNTQCRVTIFPNIPQGVQVQIPPGQPVPLIPGLPITFNVSVLSIGWKLNTQGV
jgi:hypothetical protein